MRHKSTYEDSVRSNLSLRQIYVTIMNYPAENWCYLYVTFGRDKLLNFVDCDGIPHVKESSCLQIAVSHEVFVQNRPIVRQTDMECMHSSEFGL